MKLSLTNHPQINAVIQLFNEEEHPFTKVHRMIDLFEVLIKTHTAYIISEYFRLKDVSDHIKGLLANGLISPSLGLWRVFGFAIMEDLVIKKVLSGEQYESIANLISQEQNERFKELYYKEGMEYKLRKSVHFMDRAFLRKKCFKRIGYAFSNDLILSDFYNYFFTWDQKFLNDQISTNGKKIPNLIHLRNSYAHGSTPSSTICEKDLSVYFPILQEMLQAKWLTETTIIVVDHNGELIPFSEDTAKMELLGDVVNTLYPFQPYLVSQSGDMINLFPIIHYKYLEEEATHSLVFLNDVKKYESGELGLLDYPSGLHIQEKEIYEYFSQIINIYEWKNLLTEEFEELIEQHTENFIGREKERQVISEIIQARDRGFLHIFGDPGIGKTSLMAKLVKDFKGMANHVHSHEVIYYLFGRNSRVDSFLTTLHERINRIQVTNLPIGKTIEEKRTNLPEPLMTKVTRF